MKLIRRALAILLSIFGLHAHSQQPDTLLQSILAPPVGDQSNARLGSSVAVDGPFAVAGAPADDLGASDTGVVKVFDSSTGALLFVIPNPSPAFNDGFGFSVAISGTRVVVGAPSDDTGATDAGSAYVYDLAGPTPTVPVATFNNPTPAANDQFGASVAISGTRVVVGARFDATGAVDAGSAYVYDLTSGTPIVPVATLNNPTPALSDRFGWSVGVSGTRVVVGAPLDDTGAFNAGSAYVYDIAGGTPTVPVVTLNNPSPAANDAFGNAVAISGTRVVVGAYLDDTGASDAGSAYVYDIAGATPAVPVATLNNPSPALSDSFGFSVAISGTRVVVGAYLDDTGAPDAGSAYVYDIASGTPTVPVATLNNPTPVNVDQFGISVGISGTSVVAGAPFDSTGAQNAGSAYVYDLGSATPTVPIATLNNPGPPAGDQFGRSVAVSGTRMVVGAMSSDVGILDAGIAFVYDLAGATPTVPVLTLNNPAPGSSDNFGNSVAISGTRVVVGAYRDDAGMTDSGTAYVYDLSSATPDVPVATLNNPSPANGDFFGWSVAISGPRVVVGAYRDNTGALETGSAYVYDLGSGTPTVPVATLNNPSHLGSARFGWSVGISGTRVVVGASLDSTGASGSGMAYVYDLGSGTPTVPVATLNNPSPASNDAFGWSVGISGSRVVVSAIGDDTGASEAGIAYVYDLGSGTPTVPVATLNNPTPAATDQFGYAVAISGTRAVITAYGDDTDATNAGIAYVYDLAGAMPTVPVVTLNNPTPAANDDFGLSVAIDGVTVAVGVPVKDTPFADEGAVYVFGPENTGPAGGTFTVSPSSPVETGTLLTGTFASWTDTSLPLTYSIREGATVIVPPGSSTAPTFTLPEGSHTITGRVTDSLGNFTDAAPVTVAVDGTAPSGGTFTVTPPGPVVEGTQVTLTAAGWTDPSGPLTYQFFVEISGFPPAAINPPFEDNTIPAIFPAGTYSLSAKIYDALGHETTAGPVTLVVDPAPVGDPENNRLLTRGDAVPGAGTNAYIPTGAAWYSFGVPAIDDAGHIAVIGKWKNPKGSTLGTYGSGLFIDDELKVALGTDVPGIAGAKFKAFKDPVIAGQHLALIATMTGVPANKDTVVIEVDLAGTVTVLAQEGEAAVGTSGATFKTFKSVSIAGDASPAVLYTAALNLGGGTPTTVAANDLGAWLYNGTTTLAVREGGNADGLDVGETVKVFKLLVNVSGSPGQGRGHPHAELVSFAATTSKGRSVLLDYDGSTLGAFAFAGDELGGSELPLAKWKTFGPLSESSLALAVKGVLQNKVGGVFGRKATGIFLGELDATDWEPVVQLDDEAPVPLVSGLTFKALKDPVLAPDCESLAFPATLGGAGVTSANDTSLWWKPDGLPLAMLAREGSPAVGGGVYKAFTSLAYPTMYTGPIFLASLLQGTDGITAANDVGVWGVDSAGDVRRLFREGDVIEGKTVKTITVLKAVSGSPGTTHAHNTYGYITWRAIYTDGTSGIVVTTVP